MVISLGFVWLASVHLCRFCRFLGDAWFPVLTPAMLARNRKRHKLLRGLRCHGVTCTGFLGRGSCLSVLSIFVLAVVSHNNMHVDLWFEGDLPTGWTGFPVEVVDNRKGTNY